MIKMKKLLAGLLATTILSATAMTSYAAETTVPTTDGTYTTHTVTAYQYHKPTDTSMCNGVFAGEADVTISGDTATLMLYVANPTPSWGGLESGVLSDFSIYYDGTDYVGELVTIGFDSTIEGANPDAPTKTFSQDSSFFGISSGDVLACDAIKFTLPKEALLGGTSANGYEHTYIDLTAFVNLVMNSQQKFYLDLAYVNTDSDSDSDSDITPDDENTVYSTEISATVPVNASNYSVVVPESIAIGSLDFNEDTTYDYEVAVTVSAGNDGGLTVNVTPDSEGTLSTEDSNATIALTNTLAKTTFTSSEAANGTITVKAGDVAGVAAGNYAGTINFTISAE